MKEVKENKEKFFEIHAPWGEACPCWNLSCGASLGTELYSVNINKGKIPPRWGLDFNLCCSCSVLAPGTGRIQPCRLADGKEKRKG